MGDHSDSASMPLKSSDLSDPAEAAAQSPEIPILANARAGRRPCPRLKWLGTGVCLLLAALTGFSLHRSLAWDTWDLALALRSGTLYYWVMPTDSPRGWQVTPRWNYTAWWLDWTSVRLNPLHGWLPLWTPFVVVLAPTLWLWRRDAGVHADRRALAAGAPQA